jgi:signal transduction histidine kinase
MKVQPTKNRPAPAKRWEVLFKFLDKYTIIIAAVVIYAYYLFTSIDLFKPGESRKTFLEYIFQFDSLIYLWIIAAITLQLQKYRRHQKEEEQNLRSIQFEFERQRIHLQEVDEIVSLLQENVNNPLATISLTSHTIRQKLASDDELLGMLDRIDTSLQRINSAINDIKGNQLQNIIQETMKQQAARRLN